MGPHFQHTYPDQHFGHALRVRCEFLVHLFHGLQDGLPILACQFRVGGLYTDRGGGCTQIELAACTQSWQPVHRSSRRPVHKSWRPVHRSSWRPVHGSSWRPVHGSSWRPVHRVGGLYTDRVGGLYTELAACTRIEVPCIELDNQSWSFVLYKVLHVHKLK